MKREKTKTSLTVCLDKNLFELIEKNISNRSKYIEWLIYQELLKNSSDEDIKKIII